jgi:hypothetical protein
MILEINFDIIPLSGSVAPAVAYSVRINFPLIISFMGKISRYFSTFLTIFYNLAHDIDMLHFMGSNHVVVSASQ